MNIAQVCLSNNVLLKMLSTFYKIAGNLDNFNYLITIIETWTNILISPQILKKQISCQHFENSEKLCAFLVSIVLTWILMRLGLPNGYTPYTDLINQFPPEPGYILCISGKPVSTRTWIYTKYRSGKPDFFRTWIYTIYSIHYTELVNQFPPEPGYSLYTDVVNQFQPELWYTLHRSGKPVSNRTWAENFRMRYP